MCGRPSEIVVLIVKDEPIIDDFLRRLKMPATPYLRVGDERHFYFQKPAVEVGFAIAIGPLRLAAFSDGSTVFGAGSIAPTGAVYEWSISPGGLPFAELPEPLVVTGNHMLGTQIDEGPEEDAGAFLDIAFIACGDIMYPRFGTGGEREKDQAQREQEPSDIWPRRGDRARERAENSEKYREQPRACRRAGFAGQVGSGWDGAVGGTASLFARRPCTMR